MLDFEYQPSCTFEIVISVKNALGDEVGRKSYASNKSDDIALWFERNSYRKPRKKGTKKNTEKK